MKETRDEYLERMRARFVDTFSAIEIDGQDCDEYEKRLADFLSQVETNLQGMEKAR